MYSKVLAIVVFILALVGGFGFLAAFAMDCGEPVALVVGGVIFFFIARYILIVRHELHLVALGLLATMVTTQLPMIARQDQKIFVLYMSFDLLLTVVLTAVAQEKSSKK